MTPTTTTTSYQLCQHWFRVAYYIGEFVIVLCYNEEQRCGLHCLCEEAHAIGCVVTCDVFVLVYAFGVRSAYSVKVQVRAQSSNRTAVSNGPIFRCNVYIVMYQKRGFVSVKEGKYEVDIAHDTSHSSVRVSAQRYE